MAMEKPRVKVPNKAKKGEIIEVKTLVTHPMETGLRKDAAGKVVRRQQLTVLAQLGVAGEPEDVVRAAGEVVAGLEHVDRELRKIFLDLLAPDRDDARGADNERGSVGDRARRDHARRRGDARGPGGRRPRRLECMGLGVEDAQLAPSRPARRLAGPARREEGLRA